MMKALFELVRPIVLSLLKLLSRLRSPLSVQVSAFSYKVIQNTSHDLMVIPPIPSGYSAKLSLTNRIDMPVYIKIIRVTVNNTLTYDWQLPRKIRLDPGEYTTQSIKFPASPDKSPPRSLSENWLRCR